MKVSKVNRFSHNKCIIYQLVREIAQQHTVHGQPPIFRVDKLVVLLEAAKYYLVGLLDDANLCLVHMKGVTLMPRDIILAGRICAEST